MDRGQKDSDADDGPVLSPEELDITDSEHVAEIDDGRFVVSPNDPVGQPNRTQSAGSPDESDQATEQPDGAAETTPEPTELTAADVRKWQADQFAESSSRYGFDVAATFDGSTRHRRMVSNDVVTIFESLVLWYAQGIDSTTPVEEVLGILLMETNVPIRYPPESLRSLIESTDLEPEDSIADLIEAVGDDGFRL